eukprot:2806091-Rhodomonas_salina.1
MEERAPSLVQISPCKAGSNGNESVPDCARVGVAVSRSSTSSRAVPLLPGLVGELATRLVGGVGIPRTTFKSVTDTR